MHEKQKTKRREDDNGKGRDNAKMQPGKDRKRREAIVEELEADGSQS